MQAIYEPTKKIGIPIIPGIYAISFILFWCFCYFTTRDINNWWIENILVVIAIPFIARAASKQKLNHFCYVCIFLFLALHTWGAQMSYTHNQFGAWLQDTYHLTRNPYDRIVHFSFGFLLAYPVAYYLQQNFRLKNVHALLTMFLIITFAATTFELMEWGVAAITDTATGETYVATQGDVWDAHKDIALAMLASLMVSLILTLFRKGKNI
jgi:putative membrane protein